MSDRITDLKPRPRDRVQVTLAGGRFFTIPDASAATLSVGVELSDDEIARLDRVDQYFRGKEKAQRLIALRERSRHEVKTALATLGVSTQVREGILDELVEDGLIDDARFARQYAHIKAEVRFMGPHRLRRDLAKFGIRRDIIDEVLGAEFEGDTQESMARALVDRKLGGVPIDEKAVRRMAALLQRKGFDYEIVNRVAYDLLRRAGREAEEE